MTTATSGTRRPRRPQFTAILTLVAVLLAAVLAAACGASGTTVTSPTTSVRCGVTTTASSSTLSSSGGTASIAVSTERECQWTATSDNAWLTITAGSSGQGPGTVDLAASANVTPAARTAAVVVNDQRIQVTQAAADCRFDLSDSSVSMSASGGSGSVDVRASNAACQWTASSAVSWVAITSGASGTGSSAVRFTVSPATAGPRSGALTIAGQSFTVNQTESCSYTITPATFAAPAAGGDTTVTVSTAHDCAWTAASTASWIAITPASGSGGGSVNISVAPAAGAPRTATATIAGQTFTITQSQTCSVTASPASASLDAAGGSGRIDVSAGGGCAWAAASSAAWLSVTSGASGTGNGAVVYTAAANAGPARTATISIADRVVTIAQAGGCSVSLGASGQSVASDGASLSVSVTAAAGCAWSATSAASWIAIAAGAAGSGNGVVQLAVAANDGGDRTGAVSIGGQTFTVTQAGACTASIAPDTIAVAAGATSRSVQVNTPAGCAWTATSGSSWLSLSRGGGSGADTIDISIAGNTGPARTGTATIAGRTLTVTQEAAACTFTISPQQDDIGKGGGDGAVSVAAPRGCAWTARSNVPWIAITGGASGNGDGRVTYKVDKNPPGSQERTGTLTIAGEVFTLTQKRG